MTVSEYEVPTLSGHTYCRVAEAWGGAPPLIVVHGGPGMTWDYLEGFDALAQEGVPIAYYDQLGSGRSTGAMNPSAVTMTALLEQLGMVISSVAKGGPYLLLGHSAGAVLALEHALARPDGLAGLIIANGFAAAADIESDIRRWRDALPPDARSAIIMGERTGDRSGPAYQAAVSAFFARHVCRIEPLPSGLVRTLGALSMNNAVLQNLWGPSTFALTGAYAGWTASARLSSLSIPALVYNGEYDEAGPASFRTLAAGIPRAMSEIIPQSSHLTHAEAPEETLRLIRTFLAQLRG